MNTTTLPYINRAHQPIAISDEANILGSGIVRSHVCFIGRSVHTEMYYQERLKEEFLDLTKKWKKAIRFSSNSSEIVSNSNYIMIIKLGSDVLPYILDDLAKTNNHWFVALNKITNANPVPPEHIGDIIQMKSDWLTWAEENQIT